VPVPDGLPPFVNDNALLIFSVLFDEILNLISGEILSVETVKFVLTTLIPFVNIDSPE
jgi:hypothetical protein